MRMRVREVKGGEKDGKTERELESSSERERE